MYRLIFFTITVTLLLTSCRTAGQSARIATKAEQAEILQIHNQYRKAVGTDSLIWNDDLARYALEWAKVLGKNNKCEMAHRPHHGPYKQQYGENIYWMGGKEPTVYEVVHGWASEKKYYNGEVIGKVKSRHATGHYTQIVWGATERVGCARVACKGDDYEKEFIWVCNYDPPGNWTGSYPY
jgi:hypothetical protein